MNETLLELEKLCHAATEVWGVNPQVDVALEEIAELSIAINKLSKALLKLRRYEFFEGKTDPALLAHVQEEIADVIIMTTQMRVIFDTDGKIPAIMDAKIKRQWERIKGREVCT